MQIQFYDDPERGPRPREEVRINRLGLYVYPDGRRVAVGIEISPFLERPSLGVRISNSRGQEAASLTVIEAMQPTFSLTMHLRDNDPTGMYSVEATLYYPSPDGERLIVDKLAKMFAAETEGEQ